MDIGRKIYYDNTTGDIFFIVGEMSDNGGSGIKESTQEEDLATYVALKNVDTNKLAVIQMQYGERSDEFNSGVGHKVDLSTKKLTIYGRIGISSDKQSIKADGTDSVNITIALPSGATDETITVSVDGGTPIQMTTTGGKVIFPFTATVPKKYMISVESSSYYGTNAVVLEVK